MNDIIHEIIEEINRSNTFLITAHEGPDGDAVGSVLGMASFLRKIGKDVCVYLQDPVPELYAFLPGVDSVCSSIPDHDFDVAFVLDIGEFRRTGEEFCSFTRIGKLINLDHHLGCENFGACNLIDSSAAATAVLIYRIASASGYNFDSETALCLYVAIMTDTGSFRYSSANREAFIIAGELVECGVSTWDVAERLYENQPQKRLELLACVLPTLEMIEGGHAASVTITLDMYAKSGGTAELTDGFINYPRSIRGVEVAILFRQVEEHKFKVGFRSKGKVNVASIAASLGGGGHHNAAGCSVEGALPEVKSRVYAIVDSLF
jgi:phosphoesterase RecJ-like protein